MAARARGRKGGRRPKLTVADASKASAMLRDPMLSKAEVAAHFDASRPTLSAALERYGLPDTAGSTNEPVHGYAPRTTGGLSMRCANCDEHIDLDDQVDDGEAFECLHCGQWMTIEVDEGTYEGATKETLVMLDGPTD